MYDTKIQEFKSIFSSKLARELLKQGYTIIDIKPSKENKDRTVFIFKNCESLEKYIRNLKINKEAI